MTESEVYQKILKPMFNKLNIFCHRIESPKVPDIFLAKNGNGLWCELKCINKIQKVIKPKWRSGQLSWIKHYEKYSKGQTCLILYYIGEIYFLTPKKEYKGEELLCQKKIFLNNLLKK